MKIKDKGKQASPDALALQMAVAEIAAEAWRYERALGKALKKMDVMDAERFSRQYEYFANRVDRAVAMAGLRVMDWTGSAFSVGLPVQAMNLDEFDEDAPLVITQMIEPVVMLDGRVIKTGMVMVGEKQDQTEE